MHDLAAYIEQSSLGCGGFGEVFRAVHIVTKQEVALKKSRQDGEAKARTKREIEVQRLRLHGGIMQVLDWAEDGTWFTMPLAAGDLGKVHERTPLKDVDILRLVEDSVAALGVAHRRGFLHRDISPPNILWLQDRWVVADWGCVRMADGKHRTQLTRARTAMGTVPWAAPEALTEGHDLDERADVYSVGRIVGWLVTGKTPEPNKDSVIDASNPWYKFVVETTRADRDERPRTVHDALAFLVPVVDALGVDAQPAAFPAGEAADSTAVAVDALKRFLVDPQQRIRLHDMVTRATEELIQEISGPRFDSNRLDQGDALLKRIDDYVECCRPLMHVLFHGCYFGEVQHEDLWTTCVRRVATGRERGGGNTRMLDLQALPALLLLYAGSFGAMLGKRFGNFAAVTVRPSIKYVEERGELSVASRVRVSSVLDRDMLRTAEKYKQKKTPGSDLLFEVFRELGRSVLVSDAEYEESFDRFEILIAAVSIALGGWATGRFAWKDRWMGNQDENTLVGRVRKELETQKASWPPLQAGLFEGKPEVAEKAFERLIEIAKGVERG